MTNEIYCESTLVVGTNFRGFYKRVLEFEVSKHHRQPSMRKLYFVGFLFS